MSATKRSEDSSSNGFGGTAPALNISTPLIFWMLSLSPAVPAMTLARPGVPTAKSKFFAKVGRRISASIKMTFSICPIAIAKLAATVDLPSPGTEDVTTMTLCGLSIPDNTTLVRMVRMDSENALFLSLSNRCATSLRSFFFTSGKMPSTGRFSLFSTSSVPLKVLLSISSNRLKPTPTRAAKKVANTTIKPFFGLMD